MKNQSQKNILQHTTNSLPKPGINPSIRIYLSAALLQLIENKAYNYGLSAAHYLKYLAIKSIDTKKLPLIDKDMNKVLENIAKSKIEE